MPSHKDEILKMLLRLVSDLCPEDDSIPEKTGLETSQTGFTWHNVLYSTCMQVKCSIDKCMFIFVNNEFL